MPTGIGGLNIYLKVQEHILFKAMGSDFGMG